MIFLCSLRSRLSTICTLIVSVACGVGELQAQGRWTSLEIPHFAMYTTGSPQIASDQLVYLDGVRSFFVSAHPFGAMKEDAKLEIIAFGSKAEYAPYQFRALGGGYYARTVTNDYIILGDVGLRDHALVAHEFTHYVTQHAGLKLPVWLNEGLAELYSTVDMDGKQATVGLPPPTYLERVRRPNWIPWEILFKVDVNSPQYNESDKVSLLYAQSWALTHMLAMDERYSANFRQFVTAVSDGEDCKQALEKTYLKTISEINADLLAYIHRKTLPQVAWNFEAGSKHAPMIMTHSDDFDVQFGLADVLASKPTTSAQGELRLAEVSAHFPARPEPEEVLAMLAYKQGLTKQAAEHLLCAIQRHSKNPRIYYQYAALIQNAGAANTDVAGYYQKAVEMDPDFDSAQIALALLDFDAADFEATLASLLKLKRVPAESEFEVNYTLAQCYFNLNNSKEAQRYAEKTRSKAVTEQQKKQAASLLTTIAEN